MFLEILYPLLLSLLPYCMLGLLSMVEGPVAILMGGAATSTGVMQPLPVYFSVVLGNLTADMGWYGLGRFSKMDWLTRLAPRVGFDPQKIAQLEQNIQRHAPRLLFLSKLTVGFPIPTLVATGLSRVPVRRWAGMWILGEMIKSAALLGAGYLFARTIGQTSSAVQPYLWGATAVIVLGIIVWVKKHPRK